MLLDKEINKMPKLKQKKNFTEWYIPNSYCFKQNKYSTEWYIVTYLWIQGNNFLLEIKE